MNYAVNPDSTAVASWNEGATAGEEFDNQVILESWERCENVYRLSPSARHRANVLESVRLKEERQKHNDLLQIARAEMHRLYRQFAGSGWSVLFTDQQGVVLDYVGDATLKPDFRSAGLILGAIWSEEHQGTNGIGTCIKENRPVSVHRDQHFRLCHQQLSCCGAPIWGPTGDPIAILDASTVSALETPERQQHTLALVSMSAQFISKWRFLREYEDAIIVRFHSRCEYIGLVNDGVLAVDWEGRIVGADHKASSYLGAMIGQPLPGLSIDQVFDISPAALAERAERPYLPYCGVRTANGAQLYAQIQLGARAGEQRSRNNSRVQRIPSSPSRALEQREALCSLENLRGGDPRMARSIDRAYKVIDRDIPILLNGETGTGKELLARAIHAASQRRHKPFVAVNCAAIPKDLIESELFGYRPGAFTGAARGGRKGKIEQADSGMLFLDEIGDMPLELQARLLRVLEEREIVPLGGDEPQPVDFALVSATHRDLPQLVAEGVFREDLYYRLNGLALELPPLRQRSDREQVIRAILELESGGSVELQPAVLQALVTYSWPGNIRQARNVLRTAVALCEGETIRLTELPDEIAACAEQEGCDGDSETLALQDSPLADAERRALLTELERHGGNVSRTAETLGMSRNTLYRKMRRHGIAMRGLPPKD
ncbi:hypothetical protein CAI21_17970 [Alkalilimnicola ehrlichii]|uniref:Sigma-54 factor interaction domain-containing protein n=1 Tax=Alkalilimnicola ehrlichii TaxID=351052 RepID=A0A3E0WJD8_9GAMM|nr:sigma-54-dependent Fis family transcriptional regulator [Alkalilimnicola ehrlichii]RFA25846.1 hypothetical protein CAI21_17970 [Alkalilimnicola ehrlichii]RFA33100.1 hypothetical protein CAL65_18215 [Alkalilimnicola ehrlichii]